MEKSRLEKQVEFCLEADKEKQILRQTLKTDGVSHENDAEHAWHTALMCVLLSEYSNEKIDVLKTVTMLLIHDIVEIDAGDTYAYDEQGIKSQKQRETAAADRIFGILPGDQRDSLKALWEEFDEGRTAEARFARTMDNFQPVMLNNATGGVMWRKNGVTLEQVLKRNKITPQGSSALWDYSLNNFVLPNVEKGNISGVSGRFFREDSAEHLEK